MFNVLCKDFAHTLKPICECRSARSLASSYTPTLGSYQLVGSHGGSYLDSHDQYSSSYLLAPSSLSALPSEPVHRGEARKSSPGSSMLRMVGPSFWCPFSSSWPTSSCVLAPAPLSDSVVVLAYIYGIVASRLHRQARWWWGPWG